MGQKVNRLTALKVKKETKSGWYPDGLGLYLQIGPSGSKSWVYRYQDAGKERRHGLGAYPTVSLDDARKAAHVCRKLRHEGFDPIDHKKELAHEKALKDNANKTFEECAQAYIEAHKSGWRNRKHEQQWRNTLKTYAYPVIGDMNVQKIDVELVLAVLEPIWHEKTETASRVRQRIENILDWATVRKYRAGENPARWRGHLDKMLPKRTKVQKVKHFAAMPYSELPEYFAYLRENDSTQAKALAFTILTATRSNETRNASPDEFNIRRKEWVIPEERMKAEREHRVPLSDEALTILKELKGVSTEKYVFPGRFAGKPVSDSTLLELLKEEYPDLTVHGFRSTFRDWCAETTSHPREVAEAALAHTLKDKTEAAYQRGDMFRKRKKLMDEWAEYCLSFKE